MTESKKIFIVDDDAVYLEFLKKELSNLNETEIITFASAEQCATRIDEQPDMLIIDFKQNSKDGENVKGRNALNLILERYPEMNILITSGKMNRELAKICLSHNSVGFLSKNSFDRSGLMERIRKQLYGDYISPQIFE